MTKQHVHKLKRLNYKNKESVYFCVKDCKYKIYVPLALGKESECWKCGKAFKLTEYSIRLAKPHCNACIVHKGNKDISIDEIIPTIPVESTEQLSEPQGERTFDTDSLMDRLRKTIHKYDDPDKAIETKDDLL